MFRSRAFWQGFISGFASLPNFFADMFYPGRRDDEFSVDAAFAAVDGFIRDAMVEWEATHGPVAARTYIHLGYPAAGNAA